MKKYLLLLFPLGLLLLSGCVKDVSSLGVVGANDGTNANYQPLTTGSTWTYRTDYSSAFGYPFVDTAVVTMGSKTLTISNLIYHLAYSKSTYKSLIDTGYYGVNNHAYSIMQRLPGSTDGFELLYLKDNLAVGGTWTASTAASQLGNIQLAGKIVEKGVSKLVAGKTYKNVIHTFLQLSTVISGQNFSFSYDIYVAQDVGIIRIELNEPGFTLIPEDLIAYTIK
jgi:hypothetical protein